MKKILSLISITLLLSSCSTSDTPSLQLVQTEPTIESVTRSTKEDAAYWYNGTAEITSYALQQARYGELRKGKAVFIFVTEPFSPSSGTKADAPSSENVSALKLNHTRNFTTGIYPYSLMTSSFFPFETGNHSMKLASSSQEWCGMSYMELMNKKGHFSVKLDSYFEGESFSNEKETIAFLEDDIWTMIRIRNNDLPLGEFDMYPSMIYARLAHIPFKPYLCETSLKKNKKTNSYSLNFPELDRLVTITYENTHPYIILNWSETYYDGYGTRRAKLTTTATRMNTIQTDYWNKNSVDDTHYRDSLKL